MRTIIALLAACLTTMPASAAIMFTGNAETASDGSRFISLDVDLRTFMPAGSATQVSFELEGGTLVSGSVNVLNGFDYFAFVNHPPFDEGQNLGVETICTFGGVTNCFSAPAPLPDVFNPYHTEYLGNFVSTPTSLSYTATSFRDFGVLNSDFSSCVPTVFDRVCAARGRFSLAAVFARVEGSGPISYRATFSDPVAVPETDSWTMMIMGFGLAGFALRRTKARIQPHINL